jgi:hypothetical protein
MSLTRCYVLVLAALAIMVTCGGAHAQLGAPEDIGLNYSITVGAAFPVNSNTAREVSPMLGVSWYGTTQSELGKEALLGLSGDWTVIRTLSGRDVNVVPIMLNYKQYGFGGSYRIFVNLGIGVIATTDSIPEMDLENGANLGWTASAGLDLNNKTFARARFIASDNPGDDGLAIVELGYRF